MGRTTKPELRSDPGMPENPGRMMGGSKEGWLGWWHGREHSLEKPLSSLLGWASGQLWSWDVLGAESWAVNPNPSGDYLG